MTEADQHLQVWLAADLALAEGKELRIGSRTLTRADAAEIKNESDTGNVKLIGCLVSPGFEGWCQSIDETTIDWLE